VRLPCDYRALTVALTVGSVMDKPLYIGIDAHDTYQELQFSDAWFKPRFALTLFSFAITCKVIP